jgi:hypothetical protein
MDAPSCLRVLLAVCVTSIMLPATAADRVRPGQWEGTTVASGRTFPSSSCLSQADANAMNGDTNSVQGYLEKIIPAGSCKLANVKVDGDKIVYSALCPGQPPRVITTIYHGTSSEGSDSSGSKSEGKLVGPCKSR